MRWLYIFGVVGIAATLLADIWWNVNYALTADISLIYIAGLAAAFASLYGARSRWWVNRIGKVFLAASVIQTLVLIQAAVSVWWPGDYPGRPVIRFVIYSMGATAYLPMLWSLWREQRRDRRLHNDQGATDG